MMHCSACGSRLPDLPPVTCPACGVEHWRNPKPCGSALVTHGGKLLLVKRAREPWIGRWDLPGGFCEFDEHPLTTAERELFEETGLRIRVTGLLGMWLDEYGPAASPAERQTTLNVYYHASLDAEPRPRLELSENSELGWFGPEELPAEIAFPDHAKQVLAAWRTAFLTGLTVTPLPDRPV